MQIHEKHDRRKVHLTLIGIVFLLTLVALASTCPVTSSAPRASATYIIDNQKGKFIAHAFAGGLFWFKGHDHYLAARDYSGEVELTPDSITPASLHLVVKSGSLEETGTVFTE